MSLLTFDDTIAAISTPPGAGAIAIVRLSGKQAWTIAASLFEGAKASWTPYLAMHGYIKDIHNNQLVDEVVLLPYKGPNTYTGEDLIEINCHGSAVVTTEILNLCLNSGARLARNGEFTQRAFLNGRMDLTQAEAVYDLIQAKTSRQSRLALSALNGELGEQIKSARKDLIELLSRIIAGIDFPEEVGELPFDDLNEILARNQTKLKKLACTSRSGRFLRDGLRLAIVGKPNAGKSSLLNQLLQFDRAIVTDIAGTTRDSLEELLDINGIPVILTDTAGIRETRDTVEKIGIERSAKAVEIADLVLLVCDLSGPWTEDDQLILQMIGKKPFVLLGNKVDLNDGKNFTEMTNHACHAITSMAISAKTGENLPTFTAWIESFVMQGEQLHESGGSLNARQGELCERALESLVIAQETVFNAMPQDCLATDLKSAIDRLSEVCGESVSEEVISNVFARFCIGK